jgi:hypothetical protein
MLIAYVRAPVKTGAFGLWKLYCFLDAFGKPEKQYVMGYSK